MTKKHYTTKKCLLTGLPILNDEVQEIFGNSKVFYYQVVYDDTKYHMKLCPKVFRLLTTNDEEIEKWIDDKKMKEEIVKALPIFLGEMGRIDGFVKLFTQTIHWDCDRFDPRENVIMKAVVENAKTNNSFPKNRSEKANQLLNTVRELQEFEGEKIQYKNEFNNWARLYMRNGKEFDFYLDQLRKQDLIEIDGEFVNLTFKGIDYTNNLSSSVDTDMVTQS